MQKLMEKTRWDSGYIKHYTNAMMFIVHCFLFFCTVASFTLSLMMRHKGNAVGFQWDVVVRVGLKGCWGFRKAFLGSWKWFSHQQLWACAQVRKTVLHLYCTFSSGRLWWWIWKLCSCFELLMYTWEEQWNISSDCHLQEFVGCLLVSKFTNP